MSVPLKLTAMVVQPTRGFAITNFALNTAEVYESKKDRIRFIAYGEETCPTTGRKHHQCFMYLWKQSSTGVRALNNIGKWFANEDQQAAHVEPMRGSFRDNEAYCSKEGSYTKLGEEPAQGSRGDIVENKDMIVDGTLTPDDIALSDPSHYHLYGRTYEKLHTIALRKKWRTEMTEGLWYWGGTGVGKSHKAFANYHPDTHYIKDLNTQWWDGYKGQETVILNEFRGQLKFSSLLELVDKWPLNVSCRNKESVPFLAKKVIVTSSMVPEDVYKNVLNDNMNQLRRRFSIREVVRFNPNILPNLMDDVDELFETDEE